MRSTRLAATVLLALLFGWTVRGCRKGETAPIPTPPQAITPPAAEPQKNTPPDE